MAEIMVRLDDLRRYCENRKCVSVPLEYIKQMPTIEAEPVRHGRWIKTNRFGGAFMCSACEQVYSYRGAEKYCSYCGARMDVQPESEVQKDAR